jgi:hypothetical protein
MPQIRSRRTPSDDLQWHCQAQNSCGMGLSETVQPDVIVLVPTTVLGANCVRRNASFARCLTALFSH